MCSYIGNTTQNADKTEKSLAQHGNKKIKSSKTDHEMKSMWKKASWGLYNMGTSLMEL